MTNHKNSKGYEYSIVHDVMGTYIEIYETDERGERGEMHLSVFVNVAANETVDEAIKATEIELYDPMYVNDAGEPEHIIARQRAAFQWLKESYVSVQDAKDNLS